MKSAGLVLLLAAGFAGRDRWVFRGRRTRAHRRLAQVGLMVPVGTRIAPPAQTELVAMLASMPFSAVAPPSTNSSSAKPRSRLNVSKRPNDG
jgi:hypothetical protein